MARFLWSTVESFVTDGTITKAVEDDLITFEGFSKSGDGYGMSFYKTGGTGVESQLPVDRGDNSLTDVNGNVWRVVIGSSCYYDGVTEHFPLPFGKYGEGVYALNNAGTPEDWGRVLDTSNTNIDDFACDNGDFLATGFQVSETSAEIYLPISSNESPASLSVLGSFYIGEIDGAVIENNITFTLTGRSTGKNCVIRINGLTGLTKGVPVGVWASSDNSKVKVIFPDHLSE